MQNIFVFLKILYQYIYEYKNNIYTYISYYTVLCGSLCAFYLVWEKRMYVTYVSISTENSRDLLLNSFFLTLPLHLLLLLAPQFSPLLFFLLSNYALGTKYIILCVGKIILLSLYVCFFLLPVPSIRSFFSFL